MTVPRLLLILSHMRSYSTLFAHLLASNPAIFGHAERHVAYQGEKDINLALQDLEGASVRCDNVLHNNHGVQPAVLRHEQVVTIISIRRPVETIESLVRWGGPDQRYTDERAALDYYEKRLGHLIWASAERPRQSLLILADRLIEDTAAVLNELTDFLDLDTPLQETYDVHDDTGSPIAGDFSPSISTGAIQRERPRSPIAVSPAICDEARYAYWNALDRIRTNLQPWVQQRTT